MSGEWGEDPKEVLLDEEEGGLLTKEQWLAEDKSRTEDQWDELDTITVVAEWEDKEIFLTEPAAMLYMRANAHHLTEPRTFVKHFWRNSQMELVMRALEEFSGERLKWR